MSKRSWKVGKVKWQNGKKLPCNCAVSSPTTMSAFRYSIHWFNGFPDHPGGRDHAHNGGHVTYGTYRLALPAPLQNDLIRRGVVRIGFYRFFGGIHAGEVNGKTPPAQKLAHSFCQGTGMAFRQRREMYLGWVHSVARSHHGNESKPLGNSVFKQSDLGPQAIDGVDIEIHPLQKAAAVA